VIWLRMKSTQPAEGNGSEARELDAVGAN